MFLPDKVVACLEVKSTLDKAALKDAGEKFSSLHGCQPLKVLVANQLKAPEQRRSYVGRWATELGLAPNKLPDLVVFSNNAPIIRGAALQSLWDVVPAAWDAAVLYKYGSYDRDKWFSLALLVFELAQRAGSVDRRPYLEPVLPKPSTLVQLPDKNT